MGSSCNRTDGAVRHSSMVSMHLRTHAGFGMYFLLFGLAAIFLFAGANVLPTSKNNKNYIDEAAERNDQSDGRVYQSVSGFSGTGSLCTSDCAKRECRKL